MREDKPQYVGHFTAVTLFMFLLLVSSLIPVGNGTPPNGIPEDECPPGTTGTPPNCIPEEEESSEEDISPEFSGNEDDTPEVDFEEDEDEDEEEDEAVEEEEGGSENSEFG